MTAAVQPNILPPTPPTGGGEAPAIAAPTGAAYTLTPASVLQYCEKQMNAINAQFNSQVDEIQGMNNDATMVGNLKSMLTPYATNGINITNPGAAGDTAWHAVDSQINADILAAQQEGNTQLVAQLNGIKATFETGGDATVSADEIKSMTDGLDTASSTITSNQQIAMIAIGQTSNNLNTMLTQMSQLIQGMDQTSLKIAGNT